MGSSRLFLRMVAAVRISAVVVPQVRAVEAIERDEKNREELCAQLEGKPEDCRAATPRRDSSRAVSGVPEMRGDRGVKSVPSTI